MKLIRHHRQDGFTLVELLVVIAIIGVLIALLLPAVQAARESGRRTQCSNNLKQLGLGLHSMHLMQGKLPAGYVAKGAYVDGATDTTPGWAWSTYLLPFIEQQPLYNTIRLDLAVEDATNAQAIQTTLPAYLCPSDLTPATFSVVDGFGNSLATAAPSSYVACVGGDESDTSASYCRGVFYRNSKTKMADIKDGTSNTIMLGEHAWSKNTGLWAGAISGAVCMRGEQNPCPGASSGSAPATCLVLAHSHLNNATTDTDGGLDDFSSIHPGGSNFVFADGSVHFLKNISGDNPDGSYSHDSLVFQAMGTRSEGEAIASEGLQ